MSKQAQSVQRPRLRSQRGQSMLEMAAVMPVLVVLVLAATDFGRLYYTNIEVANAARAGAQYGSQSLITAADSSGMKTAATNDGSNVSSLSTTASQCTCIAGSSVTACPASYCASNPQATFVQVNTSTTFKTIIKYPGIPSSVTLAGKAIMRVQE
jgi:Flp pilus assembly protein TadG